MARLKLDLEPDPEVSVIGISSHVKDYRLCWAINRALEIALTKRRQGIVETHDGRTVEYSAFDHVCEESNAGCTLINNHGSDGVLLRDLRQADYFLVVDKEWEQPPETMLERLRQTDLVLTAFPLSFAQLKEGHKLLL